MAKHAKRADCRYADDLTDDAPLILLARRILEVELASLRAELGHGESLAPDEIHRARIAIRRIRVALRLFEDFLPREAQGLRHEFRWLAQALGDVRDLDVYAESIATKDGEEQVDTGNIERSIGTARAAACRQLTDLLHTQRFVDLFSMFTEFAEREPAAGVARRWRSLRIRDAARTDVRRSIRRVLKRGKKIDAESSPETLHELRIRAKRLRYETEFYLDFYPGLRRLVRAAKELQGVLGEYRDACLAVGRLHAHTVQEFEREGHGSPAAPLIRVQHARAAAARRRFPSAWRTFEKAADKAKLGRKHV